METTHAYITISYDGLSDTYDILELTTNETGDETHLPIETIIGSAGTFERAHLWALTSVAAGHGVGYLTPFERIAVTAPDCDYKLARELGTGRLVIYTDTARPDIRDGDLVVWDRAGELDGLGVFLGNVDSLEEFWQILDRLDALTIPADRPQMARVEVAEAKLKIEGQALWVQQIDGIDAHFGDKVPDVIDLRD